MQSVKLCLLFPIKRIVEFQTDGVSPESENEMRQQVHGSDRITRIYGCATMWHENFDEMIEMLKSIFRIDKV